MTSWASRSVRTETEMTTAKKMLQVASKYIGTSGTDNIFNTWYWGFHCYDEEKYPWCACFQSYVAKEAGLKCSFSCSAAGYANQFERIPVEREDEVQPGDIVIFNWDGRVNTSWSDHVGLVEWSTIGQNGKFGTIEGNTGNAAGGEVARVTRDNNSYYFTAFFRPKYDQAAKPAAKPKAAKKLFGIDVSSNQPKNICALAKHDFAIVKMSGNPKTYSWNYVNDYAGQQVKDALKKSGCVGLYHFTWGKAAKGEAQFFIDQVKKLGYLGKCALVIDYEAQAVELGRAWVKEFADHIKAQTGITPIIYASGSVIVYQKLFELGYPIWCANYSKGYAEIDGRSTSGCTIYPGCEKSILWQFTSQGYVDGYDGPLDCNVFFGGKSDWEKLYGGKSEAAPEPTPEPAPKPSGNPVVYRTSNDPKGKKWNQVYHDIERDGYSGFAGKPIYFLAMDGVKRYRVCTEGDKKRGIEGGWLPWVKKYDVKDLDKGCAGDGSPINGIQVDDDSVRYAVHVMRGDGEWYDDMVGLKDTGGSNDNFAGDLANRIDAFRAKRA